MEGSSHVIISKGDFKTKLVSTTITEADKDKLYSCICMGGRMRKKAFIKHVLKMHFGITPVE